MGCIFCKISAGEIPTTFVYQDEEIVVFPDIHPSAKLHLLIVPKKHIESVAELKKEEENLVGKMIGVARELGNAQSPAGYKLIFNVNELGGQIVRHLHLHLLGGEDLRGKHKV